MLVPGRLIPLLPRCIASPAGDERRHPTLEPLVDARRVGQVRHSGGAPRVEAILDGRQPAELQLDDLLEGFPLEWERQRSRFHPL